MHNKVNWCIEQHQKTNHFYDTYLPYEFHLRMVAHVGENYKHLLDDKEYFTGEVIVNPMTQVSTRHACIRKKIFILWFN